MTEERFQYIQFKAGQMKVRYLMVILKRAGLTCMKHEDRLPANYTLSMHGLISQINYQEAIWGNYREIGILDFYSFYSHFKGQG